MPQLDSYLRVWDREFKTTLRVFENYPDDRLAYRPHEKSKTAQELMWTIATEEDEFVNGCIRGKFTFSGEKPPKTKEGIIREYRKRHAAVVKKLKNAGEALFSKSIRFWVAPKKMAPVKVGELLWDLLHDEIHHRGQLTVYLRLVGAKVPSIYGPSADEPW